jgi:hypothetical protein
MIITVEVLYKLNLTINGIPVGMNVERTHKDTYHESLVVEICIFLGLFNHNDFSIGRGHNQLVGIAIKIANRTTIEVKGNKPRCAEYYHKYPKRYGGIETVPQQ